jgi:hypothetical protein
MPSGDGFLCFGYGGFGPGGAGTPVQADCRGFGRFSLPSRFYRSSGCHVQGDASADVFLVSGISPYMDFILFSPLLEYIDIIPFMD